MQRTTRQGSLWPGVLLSLLKQTPLWFNSRLKLKDNKQAINMRASVENTIRCVIHPFEGHLCKLPVRGKKRITTMILLSTMMVNIRRITKYCLDKLKNNEIQPVWV